MLGSLLSALFRGRATDPFKQKGYSIFPGHLAPQQLSLNYSAPLLCWNTRLVLMLSCFVFRTAAKRDIILNALSYRLFAGTTTTSARDHRELTRRKPTGVVRANWARSTCWERNPGPQKRSFLRLLLLFWFWINFKSFSIFLRC